MILNLVMISVDELPVKGKPRIAGSYRGLNLPFTQKKGKL